MEDSDPPSHPPPEDSATAAQSTDEWLDAPLDEVPAAEPPPAVFDSGMKTSDLLEPVAEFLRRNPSTGPHAKEADEMLQSTEGLSFTEMLGDDAFPAAPAPKRKASEPAVESLDELLPAVAALATSIGVPIPEPVGAALTEHLVETAVTVPTSIAAPADELPANQEVEAPTADTEPFQLHTNLEHQREGADYFSLRHTPKQIVHEVYKVDRATKDTTYVPVEARGYGSAPPQDGEHYHLQQSLQVIRHAGSVVQNYSAQPTRVENLVQQASRPEEQTVPEQLDEVPRQSPWSRLSEETDDRVPQKKQENDGKPVSLWDMFAGKREAESADPKPPSRNGTPMFSQRYGKIDWSAGQQHVEMLPDSQPANQPMQPAFGLGNYRLPGFSLNNTVFAPQQETPRKKQKAAPGPALWGRDISPQPATTPSYPSLTANRINVFDPSTVRFSAAAQISAMERRVPKFDSTPPSVEWAPAWAPNPVTRIDIFKPYPGTTPKSLAQIADEIEEERRQRAQPPVYDEKRCERCFCTKPTGSFRKDHKWCTSCVQKAYESGPGGSTPFKGMYSFAYNSVPLLTRLQSSNPDQIPQGRGFAGPEAESIAQLGDI